MFICATMFTLTIIQKEANSCSKIGLLIYEKSRKLGKKMLIFGVNSRSRVNVKPKSNDENERERI